MDAKGKAYYVLDGMLFLVERMTLGTSVMGLWRLEALFGES